MQEGTSEVSPTIHDMLRSPGQPPDGETRASMEPGLGHDFSRIPVYPYVRGVIQTKLTINAPGDKYEQEADRIADQVLAKPAHHVVGGTLPRIQRFGGQPTGQMDTVPASVDRVLASPGRPLEPALRQEMEGRFGHDFSRVQVYTGAAAEQSAWDVNAHAYTAGSNIVFGKGQFAVGTHEGRALLAHELAHTIQQCPADGSCSPSSSSIQRKPRAQNPKVTKIEFWKPHQVVLFLDNNKTYTEAVKEHCNPLPGSFRARLAARGGEMRIIAISEAPKCIDPRRNYLYFDNHYPKYIEPGSEVEITIISEEFTGFLKPKSSYGVFLDAATRSRMAKAMQKAGVTDDDWFDFLSTGRAGGTRPKDAKEFAVLFDRFIAERQAQRQQELQTTQTLEGELSSTRDLSQGLDETMVDIYRDYQQLEKLSEVRSQGVITGSVVPLTEFARTYPEALEQMRTKGQDFYYAELRNRIQKNLENYGFDIPEFERRIAAFELAFRNITIQLGVDLLERADHVCQRFLVERKEFEFIPWQAKKMLASLEDIRQPAGAIIASSEKSMQEAMQKYAENTFSCYSKECKEKAIEGINELNLAQTTRKATLDWVTKALPRFPFVAWPDFPRKKLLEATDPKEVDYRISLYILEHQSGIKETIKQLKSKSRRRIYKFDILIALAKQKFNIAEGSIFDLIINDEVKKASKEGLLGKIKTALMFALMFVSMVVPGAIGVAAAIGTGILSAEDAYNLLNQYYEDLAAHKANLSSLEPSQFWVIVAIVGAGLDAKGAIDLFSKSAGLRKAMQNFKDARELTRLSEDLARVSESELTPEARKAILEEAEKQLAKETHLGKTAGSEAIAEPPRPASVAESPKTTPMAEPPKPAEPAVSSHVPATTPTGFSEAERIAKEIDSLGGISKETIDMLKQKPKLLHKLAENRLAAQVLKHCSKICYPAGMKVKQIQELNKELLRLQSTGRYDVALINDFLYKNRDNLDEAISVIWKHKTSRELDNFLNAERGRLHYYGERSELMHELEEFHTVDEVLQELLRVQGTNRDTFFKDVVLDKIKADMPLGSTFGTRDYEELKEALGIKELPWPDSKGPDLILVNPNPNVKSVATLDLTRTERASHAAEKAVQTGELEKILLGKGWKKVEWRGDFYHKSGITTEKIKEQIKEVLEEFGMATK